MLWHLYETSTSRRVYPIEVRFVSCSTGDLTTMSSQQITDLCRPCSRFGKSGGCPPFAPPFERVTARTPHGCLIVLRFWSRFKPDQVRQNSNPSMHWRFQDAVLTSLLNQIGRAVAGSNGVYLGSGFCRGCPGQRCGLTSGDATCRRPAKRTCSLEATGVNVADAVRRLTGIELLWYSKRDLSVPYLCKVGAVFGNVEYRHEERQIESLLDGLSSCFAAHNTARYRDTVSSFGIEV